MRKAVDQRKLPKLRNFVPKTVSALDGSKSPSAVRSQGNEKMIAPIIEWRSSAETGVMEEEDESDGFNEARILDRSDSFKESQEEVYS